MSLYIAIATASAKGRFQLNHFLVTDLWDRLYVSVPFLMEYTEKIAIEIDQFTKERWSVKLPYSEECKTEPTELAFITKTQVIELNLNLPKNPNDVYSIIGKPYCTLDDEVERWILKDGSLLDIEYNPVRINYNADSRP
jgi:hypothetical protein